MKQRLKRLLIADAKGLRITQPLVTHMIREGDNAALVPDTIGMRKILRMLTQQRKSSERHGAFHSSQLYQCPRSQIFGYLGVPGKDAAISPELRNIFNDGTWRHIRWQITLLNAGIITHVEVPVIVPGYRFAGSIDGTNEDELWGLELKGTSQFQVVKQYGALPSHVKQVHGYLTARPDLEKFIVLYEDKSTNQWHEVHIERDPKIVRQIERILNALNEAIDNKQLPEVLNECEYGEGAYKGCPFSYLCKQVQYAEAEVAAKCSDQDEVKVELGLTRNSHRRRADTNGANAAARGHSNGATKVVRTRRGTLKLSTGVTRS